MSTSGVITSTYGHRCSIKMMISAFAAFAFVGVPQMSFANTSDKSDKSGNSATSPDSKRSVEKPVKPEAAAKVAEITKSIDATETPSVSESRQGSKTFAVGKVLVKAPASQIWKILTDYNNAPEIFSNLRKCEVVEDKGRNKLVRQLVHPKGTPINLDYIVEITETAPTLMEWHRKSGALKEVAGSWRLEQPDSDGPTKVTYSIYLDGGMLLPAWLLRGQSKSYLPELLNAIKQASEQKVQAQAHKISGSGVQL